MKLTTLYLAAATGLSTIPGAQAAPAPVMADPVLTDTHINDFFNGKVNHITCSSNGESVQIVPLEDSAGHEFVAIGQDKATPLGTRQAAVNACMEIGLK
ncbi:MAG: hypothetical protein WC989_08365 [Micavibrio sp.]